MKEREKEKKKTWNTARQHKMQFANIGAAEKMKVTGEKKEWINNPNPTLTLKLLPVTLEHKASKIGAT